MDFLADGLGKDIVQELAKFWVSRSTYNSADDTYRINHVMCPDESHYGDNSAYTNSAAVNNLKFANQINDILKKPRNRTWENVARKMYIPYDEEMDYHPEFSGYTIGETVKQADVVLMNVPLMVDMKPSTMKNDLIFYEKATPGGPAMTWGMFLIGWLQLGNETKAEELLYKQILNAQEPFKIWTEVSYGSGAINFATGMGGYLQSPIFGYGGCRIYDDRLEFQPRLLPNTTQVKFVDIDYRGFGIDLDYDINFMRLRVTSSTNTQQTLEIKSDGTNTWKTLHIMSPVVMKRQKFVIRVSQT